MAKVKKKAVLQHKIPAKRPAAERREKMASKPKRDEDEPEVKEEAAPKKPETTEPKEPAVDPMGTPPDTPPSIPPSPTEAA